jgi:hypothetical protein
MTRTSIRLSLLAAAACLALGAAQAQTPNANRGASPNAPGTAAHDLGAPASSVAPGTQAQDQDTSAKDLTPGNTVRNPASDTTTAPKAKKKHAKKTDKSADKTESAEPTSDTTQPVK